MINIPNGLLVVQSKKASNEKINIPIAIYEGRRIINTCMILYVYHVYDKIIIKIYIPGKKITM